jgi:SNF2 family DNA or RNA helicase
MERHDDKLALIVPDTMIELARSIPGMSHDRNYGCWLAPLSPLTVLVAWRVFNGRIEMDQGVTDYMADAMGHQAALTHAKAGAFDDAIHPHIADGLWPLQRAGVAFLASAPEAYLCDEMGSGKTIQVIRALDLIMSTGGFPYPALVVANKSALRSAWEQEIEQWSLSVDKVSVVEGTAAKRRKALEAEADVYLISWDNLRNHSRLDSYGNVSRTDKEKEDGELNAIPFRTVIIDEAHKAKDWRAKRTRALWAVAHAPTVERRWSLTGTPVTGYEQDVWGIGHTTQPTWYPRKTQWLDRYVSISRLPGRDYPIYNGFEPANYQEMVDAIDPFMLRRTKADIIPDYQGKLPLRTVHVEMGAKQKKAYNQMSTQMLAQGEGGILAAPSPIEQLLRLNQFAAATPVIEEGDDGIMKVTGLTMPSCKVDALLEIIEEMGDQQAVVFQESRLLARLVAEQLAKHKISYMTITGDDDDAARFGNIQAFQSGVSQIAVCTYGAGAESITLNNADTVIRLQRTYNYVLDTQAPDRVDRGYREVPVQVIDLVTQ